jgi:hypothetical protein
MVDRSETLEVEVRNQILWVGAEAYPVHNIARAQTIALTPRRGRAVFRFVGYVLLWIILGLGAAAAIDSSEFSWLDPNLLSVVPAIVGVLILISLIALIRTLARPTLYALVIETSGNPHTALVTKNEHQLRMFVQKIMAAINNPKVEYGPIYVKHFGGVQVSGGKVGNIGDHGQVGSMS